VALSGLFSLLLLVAGIATSVGAAYQREVEGRGWADPTTEAALPYRVPLAGVNADLRQYDDAALTREVERMARAGFVWLRQSFYWSEIEPAQGQFTFSAYERIVEAVRNQPTLKIVAVLEGTPAWARRLEAADRLMAPPASMSAFGAFAGQVAARYADQIDHYQIWDEPNLNTNWGGLDPRPADYAAMLKAAHTAIHGADAAATVIMAGLAPTVEAGPRNLSDVLFLRALYEAGAKDAFEAVAGKPYGFNTSPLDRTVDPTVLNFSRIILLREEMLRYGDGDKAVWGSHFGWNHLPDGWQGPPSIWGQVDAATQRDWTLEAYARAEREWAWLGGLILHAWRPNAPADDPVQGFAVDDKAAAWFEDGAFFARPALGVGLHHPSDPRLAYTGDWEFGALGADVQHKPTDPDPPEDGSAHQLRFAFTGEVLALKVRRSDYVAFSYVRVNEQPANALPRSDNGEAFIIMRTPTLQPSTDLIVAANGLGAGVHQAQGKFYLAHDQWVLAGIAVGSAPDLGRFNVLIAIGLIVAAAGMALGALTARRLPRATWQRTGGAVFAYVRRMADIMAGVAVSLLALIGMFFTFRNILPEVFNRETPTFLATVLTAGLAYFSGNFVLTVAALGVLWVIVYNRPVVGLALVIFWSPFWLSPIQLYLWAFPMVEVSLVLTLTAVLVRWLVGWAARRGDPAAAREPLFVAGKLTGLDWAMVAFVTLATVSLLWAEQTAPALRTWRTMVIEPALCYFLVRRLALTAHDLTRLVDVLLLAAAGIAVIGLVQFFTGIEGAGIVIAEQGARRLTSVYWSPNNAALFLGRCIPFGLALVLVAPTTLRKVIAGIVTAIMGVAVLLTQSAGGLLLGVPAGAALVLLLWRRRVGYAALGLIVVGLVAVIPLSQAVPRLRGLLDLSRSSSFVRTQIWTSTVYLLRDHPLTGVGLDQFLYQYRGRYILPDAWREPNLSHPHNVVLDYWVSLGVGGPVILAAQQVTFWLAGLRVLRRRGERDPLAVALVIGALGSMAAFLAHGLVDNSYFVIDLAFVFCFTMALVGRVAVAPQASGR
jgi:O-antigen ligase